MIVSIDRIAVRNGFLGWILFIDINYALRIGLSSKSAPSRIFGFLLFLGWISSAFGAFELDSPGPRGAGLGGAGVALIGDGWGGLRNPALICGKGMVLATDWSQQFGLPELNHEVFTLQSRYPFAGLGVQGSTFGSELYRETSLELA